MPGKRLLCLVLIAGLILPGCSSRQTPPPQPAMPVPLPVNPGAAAPYDRSNTDDARRPGALRILCEDIRFAKAARPVYLLPDLPQIREYFANYYGVFIDKGVSDARPSEHFRELYARYTRSAKADMGYSPPRISFDRIPAGSWIVFFAPRKDQPAQDATDPQATEDPNDPQDMFMLRVRLAAAKTTTLTLGEMDAPRPGDTHQRSRRLLAKDAPLPPDAGEADAILLQNGERLVWPEGEVLRLPMLPASSQQKKSDPTFLEVLGGLAVGVLVLAVGAFVMYCQIVQIVYGNKNNDPNTYNPYY